MKTHGPSQKTLIGVWLALLALLFLTWGVAKFNLGEWNIVAAMIAVVAKVLLVVCIFMPPALQRAVDLGICCRRTFLARHHGHTRLERLLDARIDGLPVRNFCRMVEPKGFEPMTPTMPLWCSTN